MPNPSYPGHTLQFGSHEAAVATFATRLAALGYAGQTVGQYFGPGRLRAVMAFQRDRSLQVTGVVDQETWEAAWTSSRVATPGFAGSAPSSSSITLKVTAEKPHQLDASPPQVDFVGHAYAYRNGVLVSVSEIIVVVYGYKDGAQTCTETDDEHSSSAALADAQSTKAIGTHNYQAFAHGTIPSMGLSASAWSAIWTGSR